MARVWNRYGVVGWVNIQAPPSIAQLCIGNSKRIWSLYGVVVRVNSHRIPSMSLVLMSLTTLACVAYDTVKHRRLHPVFGWGFLFIAASCPLRLWLGGTEAWHRFAVWLIS